MAPNLTPDEVRQLSRLLGKLGDHCYDAERGRGFCEPDSIEGVPQEVMDRLHMYEAATKMALIAGESIELLEAWRLQDPHGPCPKDPRLTHMSEEMADVLVRLVGLAARYRVDLAQATAYKLEHNSTRPPKHGKRF